MDSAVRNDDHECSKQSPVFNVIHVVEWEYHELTLFLYKHITDTAQCISCLTNMTSCVVMTCICTMNSIRNFVKYV